MRQIRFLPLLLAVFVLAAFSNAPVDDKANKTPGVTSWTVDQAHSQVKFKVRHLGFANVEGRFKNFELVVQMNPADLKSLRATAKVDVKSIDTGIERRDDHLRSDDFFDAAGHPEITFVSTGVKDVNNKSFKLLGNLTIRGTTKPVVFDAEMLGTTVVRGKKVAGFTASTTINRFDYGLKWNSLTEAGGLVVGEDVKITIDLEATQDQVKG